MSCPYCGAGFRIRRTVSREQDRLEYGLIECRCFVFPVVDGSHRRRSLRAGVGAPVRRLLRPAPRPELPTVADYYAARYFSPRVNALALQFAALPPARRILSLCCGQGVFENLLGLSGHAA